MIPDEQLIEGSLCVKISEVKSLDPFVRQAREAGGDPHVTAALRALRPPVPPRRRPPVKRLFSGLAKARAPAGHAPAPAHEVDEGKADEEEGDDLVEQEEWEEGDDMPDPEAHLGFGVPLGVQETTIVHNKAGTPIGSRTRIAAQNGMDKTICLCYMHKCRASVPTAEITDDLVVQWLLQGGDMDGQEKHLDCLAKLMQCKQNPNLNKEVEQPGEVADVADGAVAEAAVPPPPPPPLEAGAARRARRGGRLFATCGPFNINELVSTSRATGCLPTRTGFSSLV